MAEMVIVLGLGFTGQRLARRLLHRGERVFAAVRGVDRFRDLATAGLTLSELTCDPCPLPRHATIAHLIPPLPPSENVRLRGLIEELEPARVVYISSTGVYGDRSEVDEESPVEPNDERGRNRLAEEIWIRSHSWSSLILRAAAIYGPGRGVHVAVRQGKAPRGAGSGIVSRIHVDDLAAITEAGIYSTLEGAWPVADDEPCATGEIVAWCVERYGTKDLPSASPDPPIAGRRVNGEAIRRKLGVALRYHSWKTGIPASIQEDEK